MRGKIFAAVTMAVGIAIAMSSCSSKEDFRWFEFDKAYFVFIHDDTNEYLEYYYEPFRNHDVPFSAATIPSNINDTHLKTLHDIVDHGGEVLAHYMGSPQHDSPDSLWLACTRDVKHDLENYGFSPKGIIRADNTEASTEKGEEYCRKYFLYANDKMGLSVQYDIPRTLMLRFRDREEFMQQIEKDKHVKGIHAYGFHGGRDDEKWVTDELFDSLITDLKQSEGCEIVTYEYLYNKAKATAPQPPKGGVKKW